MFKLSRNRRASGFAQIPNAALRDTGLSARARGVLCYMLSHSDDFEITRKMLGSQFTEGRDAMDKAVRELREAGYLRVDRVQGENGRFQGTHYLVFDERGAADFVLETRTPENQQAADQNTGRLKTRSPENPQPYKNTIPIEHQLQEHQENTTRASDAKSAIESGFAWLWSVYPRKVGKRAAHLAFDRAVRRLSSETKSSDGPESAIDEITAGAARFAAATREAGTETRFVPHPSTWLNGDRWRDESGPVPARELTAAESMAAGLQQAPIGWDDNPWISEGELDAIEQ